MATFGKAEEFRVLVKRILIETAMRDHIIEELAAHIPREKFADVVIRASHQACEDFENGLIEGFPFILETDPSKPN